MVLWEITLGTAYFLGLKRTYRLALKIQRRLIGPKHPRIRQFLHRRTRMVFDVALKVHRNIQERDIKVGRNLGNWILRWLNRMKPSAQIRVSDKTRSTPSTNMNMMKQVKGTTNWKSPGSFNTKSGESDRHMFTSLSSTWQKPFPAISMMMRSAKPLGNMTQYRHLNICQPEVPRLPSAGGGFDGVIRKDIMQWMLKK